MGVRGISVDRDDEPLDIGWTAIDQDDPRFEPNGLKTADWPADGAPTVLVAATFWRSNVVLRG